jgi:hypothetical protein
VSAVDDRLRLFVGHKAALQAIVQRVSAARIVALVPAIPVYLLPLTDEVHEGLHRINGTGEWLDFAGDQSAPLLTTTDMAFAARASAGSALAWIEAGTAASQSGQIAAAWIDGALQMKPTLMRNGDRRPPSLQPVNMALRLLGVAAGGPGSGQDEFAALGLTAVRFNEDILERGIPIRA